MKTRDLHKQPPQSEFAKARQAKEIIAQALKDRPGEWHRVEISKTSGAAAVRAYKIRRGKVWAFTPAGDFDARGSGSEVYARYVGGAAE